MRAYLLRLAAVPLLAGLLITLPAPAQVAEFRDQPRFSGDEGAHDPFSASDSSQRSTSARSKYNRLRGLPPGRSPLRSPRR